MKKNPSLFLAFFALAAICAPPTSAQNLEEIYKSGQKICQHFYKEERPPYIGWNYCVTKQGEVFDSRDAMRRYGRQGELRGYIGREVAWSYYSLKTGKIRYKVYFRFANNGNTLEKYSCDTTSKGECTTAPVKTSYQYVFDINELNREVRGQEQERAARLRERERALQQQQEDIRRGEEERRNGGTFWWQTYPKRR